MGASIVRQALAPRERSVIAAQRLLTREAVCDPSSWPGLGAVITCGPVFSRRLPWEQPENALAVLQRSAEGGAFIDLTVSNPTQVGLTYPTEALRQALAPPELIDYQPAPRGLLATRAAIAADQQRHAGRRAVDPERLLVTASSSESYGWLFKLLCDPGDSVLVPEPSYPLFEYLARLEGVTPIGYRLAYDGTWHVDLPSVTAALEQALARGTRPRALVVVNPNNPTGSYLKHDEQQRLAALCAQAGLAMIADEVFADYPLGAARDVSGPARRIACAAVQADADADGANGGAVLTFSLGGLSKSAGLPQLKLGWILAGGPAPQVAAALDRLELIADTYLSVATPVQLAAPRLLALAPAIRAQIQRRVNDNRMALHAGFPADSPCTLLDAEGGWSAIVRVPALRSDADWAGLLLQQDGILVQPGYFFDLPSSGTFLVLSLLPPPELFTRAVGRLLARCGNSDPAVG